MAEVVLSMTDVHKSFGPVQALRGAQLELRRGEIDMVLAPLLIARGVQNKVLEAMAAPVCQHPLVVPGGDHGVVLLAVASCLRVHAPLGSHANSPACVHKT